MNNRTDSNPPAAEPVLRPHSFDGIQEYDQRLPNWWLFTFYIAIAFTVVYWVAWYQFGLFAPDDERLAARLAVTEIFNPSNLSRLTSSELDVELWKMSRTPEHVDRGRETYRGLCAACHGPDLTAKLNGIPLPGLPLNDIEWKYGAKASEILKVVSRGSPDITKGMVAWEPQLGPTKVRDVVVFVLSHHTPPEGLLDPPPTAGAVSPSAAN